MRPPVGGRKRHIGEIEPGSARGRPGRGGRGGRRGGLARAPWRSAPAAARAWAFSSPGQASGPPGRPRRLQFDKDRVRHEALRPPRSLRSASTSHHPHRHGLRLVARQREAHGEFVGRHRERAGGPAGLSERCPGLGAGRLGFELHGGCRGRRLHEARRIELHPARHARACRRGSIRRLQLRQLVS